LNRDLLEVVITPCDGEEPKIVLVPQILFEAVQNELDAVLQVGLACNSIVESEDHSNLLQVVFLNLVMQQL